MKRWLPLVLPVMVVAGCAGIPNEDAFRSVVSAWEGHDVNELIGSWGPPASTYPAPGGGTVYTYYEGQLEPRSCTVSFTVNSDHKIAGWRFSGTACRTTY